MNFLRVQYINVKITKNIINVDKNIASMQNIADRMQQFAGLSKIIDFVFGLWYKLIIGYTNVCRTDKMEAIAQLLPIYQKYFMI